jgi:RNA polymerase sigma-70 factor (ECF subfamily)
MQIRASPLSASRDIFREIVERHQARVFSIAFRIIGDSGAAEEIAQDVFLELHRNLSRLESEQHIVAWLRRVTCHRATDALRRRAVRTDIGALEFHEQMSTAPLRQQSPSSLLNRVEQLLLTLPPAQRSVMLLRYQEDLEAEEIAEMLVMPVATVKSHIQRALKTLRAKAERTLKEYTRG